MASPYRVPCAPETEAPEVEHPYVRVLRSQHRRARVLAAFAVVGVAFAVAGFASSRSASADARRASARARVSELERENTALARNAVEVARSHVHATQQRFEQGMAAARARGDGALAACTPDVLAGKKATVSVVEEAAHGLPSRTVDEALADVRRAELHVTAGRLDTAAAYADSLTSGARYGHEIVVVAKAARTPKLTSTSSYEPGLVEGRAYLWSFQEGRVLCAADVRAESSHEVDFTYLGTPDAKAEAGRTSRLAVTLEEDLARAVERAAREALVRGR